MTPELEGAPTEPRPVFSTECRPDVVVRLQRLVDTKAVLAVSRDLRDAIDTIKGLRDSDERRLRMVNDLKLRVAELESALRDLLNIAVWDCTTGNRDEADRVFRVAHEATALPASQPAEVSGNG